MEECLHVKKTLLHRWTLANYMGTIFKFHLNCFLKKPFHMLTLSMPLWSITQAASERCYVNIGVLRICVLIYIFRNFWSKSLKNTCEEVHFLLSCRLWSLQLNKKWTSSQVFFKDFDQKFTNTFFTEHLLVTASAIRSEWLPQSLHMKWFLERIWTKFGHNSISLVKMTASPKHFEQHPHPQWFLRCMYTSENFPGTACSVRFFL